MRNDDMNRDAQIEQELQKLRKQHDALRDTRVRTEQNIRNLEERLDLLKKQAQSEFGTDDPEELGKLLQARREENERLVSEYRTHIEEIRNGLAQVEAAVERSNG